MITVLLLLTCGIFAGYLVRNKKKFIRYADISMNYAIYLLLLVLGISIGSNEMIISNIGKIGLHSLFISLSAILGSIIISYITFVVFFKKAKDEK